MGSPVLLALLGFIKSPAFFPVLSMALGAGAALRWYAAGSIGQAAWWAIGVVSTFVLTFVIGGGK